MFSVYVTKTALAQWQRATSRAMYSTRLFTEMHDQLERDPTLGGAFCRHFDPARYATGLGIVFGDDVRGNSWWRHGTTIDYLYSIQAQVVVIVRIGVDQAPMM